MTTRRTFPPEFKFEAASLVLDQGYSISQACRALDGGQTALKGWVDQLQLERKGQAPTATALTSEHRVIQQLKARIHQLEQEKMILKKATALFMKLKINLKLCPIFLITTSAFLFPR